MRCTLVPRIWVAGVAVAREAGDITRLHDFVTLKIQGHSEESVSGYLCIIHFPT